MYWAISRWKDLCYVALICLISSSIYHYLSGSILNLSWFIKLCLVSWDTLSWMLCRRRWTVLDTMAPCINFVYYYIIILLFSLFFISLRICFQVGSWAAAIVPLQEFFFVNHSKAVYSSMNLILFTWTISSDIWETLPEKLKSVCLHNK